MTTTLQAVTDANFDTLVSHSDIPVLVDFWAAWCGPCQRLNPILEELAQEYADQITVVKLDVEANKVTTEKFGIKGIPALILFKDGKPAGTKLGLSTLTQLSEFIDTHL